MRALLADDEPALLAQLERLLRAAAPTIEIVGRAANGREALALAQHEQPDVAFLDIRMPAPDGLAVARALPSGVRVVFVTAYDEHAVEAFEAAAADYLLKPVSADRLQQCLARLESTSGPELGALAKALEALTQAPPERLRWLRVGDAEATELVAVDDVLYFQAEHKYTNAVLADRTHLLRTSISTLEQQLDPDTFWRVHRSYIVNATAIVQARKDLKGRYVLSIRGRKESLRTSQSYAHLFRQM